MTNLPAPHPDCAHPTRFLTLGGIETCETCARLDAGWKTCKECKTMVAPDERRCEFHKRENWVDCPDCGGEGDVECEELDCHGMYCEEGYVYCETCGGDGEVLGESAA